MKKQFLFSISDETLLTLCDNFCVSWFVWPTSPGHQMAPSLISADSVINIPPSSPPPALSLSHTEIVATHSSHPLVYFSFLLSSSLSLIFFFTFLVMYSVSHSLLLFFLLFLALNFHTHSHLIRVTFFFY